jgi:hypothetical protein
MTQAAGKIMSCYAKCGINGINGLKTAELQATMLPATTTHNPQPPTIAVQPDERERIERNWYPIVSHSSYDAA